MNKLAAAASEKQGQHEGHQPGVGPRRPPPGATRHRAVREQQDDHRKHGKRRRLHRAQQQGQRSQQKPVVAETVIQHRVVAGGGAEHVHQREHDHDPADRVAWLAPRDHQPHRGKGQDDDQASGDADRQVTDEGV
jgi:hypothetical protein